MARCLSVLIRPTIFNICYDEEIMNIKMTKFWFNRLLSLFLVTAFLTMQWTPVHIHLSEQHDHDGVHHQHLAETHAHNLSNQTITIDISHQTSHTNVIVLGQEYSLSKQDNQKNLSTALVTNTVRVLQPFLLVSIKIPFITSSKLSYFDLSTVNPRAPPQIS
jgi:hypothetical protein